jgi:23S rRNA pseudouridine1911/1915/1917 synthase
MRRPRHSPLRIVFEDDHLLVVDKPPGLLTSTVPRERRATLLALVTEYLARASPRARVGLIHRLDRDASGLLVFSKNPRAYHSLKKQFFQHTVDRIYHALTRGQLEPAAGRIESRLVELPDGRVRSTRRRDAGQPARTEYQTIRTTSEFSLLRVKLHTGRKHQIRAHLSERGAPIVNDPLYSDSPRTGRLMLAATELAFDHPRTGGRLRFELPLPREMSR